MKRFIFYGIAIVTVFTFLAQGAGVPKLINYQGQLTSSTGVPLDTSVAMAFAIYDATTGGSVIWTETQNNVVVTKGMFTVYLGEVNPITAIVLADSIRYLGVKIGSDPEISPRTRLATVPWAFRIATIDGAEGGTISGNLAISGKGTFGADNSNGGLRAFVAGADDTVTGDYSFIGGGQANRSDSNWAFIGGGVGNKTAGEKTTVGGGAQNIASGWGATVAGGIKNVAAGVIATVAGGGDNVAQGHYSTVSGGQYDTSGSFYATVSGGDRNKASGQWSTVPGGALNTASSDFTFAFGRRAKADHYGTLVWADGTDADFASTGANQFLIRASGGVGIGTDSPTTALEVNGIIYSFSGGFKFPDGTIQTTSASGAGGNADMVDGFHAQANPGPNRLLPLDGSSNFVITGSTLTGLIRGANTAGPGIHGISNESIGVYGECTGTGNPSATAYGVRGYATNTFTGNVTGGDFSAQPGGSGDHFGVTAWSTASNAKPSRGIYSYATNAGTGDAIGGDIVSRSTGTGGSAGVTAYADASNSAVSLAVLGYAGNSGAGVVKGSEFWAKPGGTGVHYGVRAFADGGSTSYGIWAQGAGATGSNWAGYFNGNVNVVGILSKGGGAFRIDHPLDPENKYLQHSFVESPDMMNVYNGNVTTDTNGIVSVVMPEYFSALNKEFRYQLTVIGQFSQAIIEKEIENNQFVIRTDKPNIKVSWQVTGIRRDKFAEANRIMVEIDKLPDEQGKYLYPDAYGQPIEKGIDYENMKRLSGSQPVQLNRHQ